MQKRKEKKGKKDSRKNHQQQQPHQLFITFPFSCSSWQKGHS
jgi:hypothetical protein